MKKIVLFAVMLCTAFNASADDFKREGNNFIAEKKINEQSANKAQKTEYSFTDTDKKVYPIYVSANGRAYIIRTSKNGNEYKKYLGEELSRTICKELNIEYKETKKK